MTNTVQLNQTEAQILRALLAKAKLNGKQNGKPVVFAIQERENLVVLKESSYQKLLEKIDEAETIAAINEAWEDVKAGRVRPAKEVMEEIRKEFGLSKPRVKLR
jgi:PHD/YefM family antitoxin component YafN of YafNO toxin-antitoxin module